MDVNLSIQLKLVTLVMGKGRRTESTKKNTHPETHVPSSDNIYLKVMSLNIAPGSTYWMEIPYPQLLTIPKT